MSLWSFIVLLRIFLQNTKVSFSQLPAGKIWVLFHQKQSFLMQNQSMWASNTSNFFYLISNILTGCRASAHAKNSWERKPQKNLEAVLIQSYPKSINCSNVQNFHLESSTLKFFHKNARPLFSAYLVFRSVTPCGSSLSTKYILSILIGVWFSPYDHIFHLIYRIWSDIAKSF